jgi:uncharacterized membrane protein YphA (DoxX/SURF4 family)
MAFKPWHLPLRLVTGAYILNSGLGKQDLPSEAAAGMQQMATNAVPQLGDIDPKQFATLLSTAEVVLGASLLAIPLVPPFAAGVALTAFSIGLNRMYMKTPGMTEEGSTIKPSQQGTAIAKDFWMTGIGAALILDSLFSPKRHR